MRMKGWLNQMVDADRTDTENGEWVVDSDARLVSQDDDEEYSKDNPANCNKDGPFIKPKSARASRWKRCHVL
jgi:hypothetical protein